MNVRYVAAMLCLAMILPGLSRGEIFVSTDVPVSIPDGPWGIGRSHLTITENREILDLNIRVTIVHTFVHDLRLYLEAPGGEIVRLADQCDFSSDNYTNTRFDDEATVFICNGTPPYTGNFTPDQPLYAFDHRSTFGEWEFRVTDNADQDTGRIVAWQLEIVLGDTLDATEPIGLNPISYSLTAYPNPFNSSAIISFVLPQPQMTDLVVYDIVGREVEVLARRELPAGEHRSVFDGSQLPSGIYFAHLTAGHSILTHKLILMR